MKYLYFYLTLVAIFVLGAIKLLIAGDAPTSPIAPVTKSLASVISPTPTYKPAPVSAVLPAAVWVPQSYNNCGPAATAMVLQYFGYNVSQEETKAHLRTNPDDKNVFIWEISDYLKNDYGIQSKVMYGGDLATLKLLIANGYYVVVEDFLHPNEDIGHVLIIHGYDDTKGVLIADDSYFGVNQTYSYDTWDKTQWRPYNREYMPVYTKDKEALLKSILGDNWDQQTMYQHALSVAQNEIAQNNNDMYAYFNAGSSYFGLGDYKNADIMYEKSRQIGWPKRMLWYQFQPVQTKNLLGKYNDALTLADEGLWANDTYAEMHVEKAKAYKGLGQTALSQQELTTAISLDPKSHL